ncbi:MAG: hypothetical protein KGL15_06565, partial [Acidobacteriota bacterium]|nr:hypothetical protein [Acidobacteriota bacterium]
MADPPADLSGYLERRESLCPGGEQGIAAELVELCQQRDERVVSGLDGEIVEIPTGGVGQRGGAEADLVA